MIRIESPMDCCGCTACESVCAHKAIVMRPDSEGFMYPHTDAEKCAGCGLCEKACPIVKRKTVDLDKSTVLRYCASRIKNQDVLMSSSSGGAFSALASVVIGKGGVVCGAVYGGQQPVSHVFAETMEELARMRGSKYVQSDLRGVFSQVLSFLRHDRWVLFAGTPCQVDGLRGFLRGDYPKLITADLVCHGVPSPLVYREYVALASRRSGREVAYIDMRYKPSHGWSHDFSYRFHYTSGETEVDPPHILDWGRLMFSELVSRPVCGECPYTNLNRVGDFTLADFWDDDHLLPELYSTRGTSLCLVNSDKGLQLLGEVEKVMDVWQITKEAAMQPCLYRNVPKNPRRKLFWEFYGSHGFEATYEKFFVVSRFQRFKNRVKRMLGIEHKKLFRL